MGSAPKENRLAGETSPYLLQHRHNPVDWYPWGDEALARARDEDRPIFLSIGYSACHWCHVMERESFQDPAVADLLNAHFVPIKVDREERPDIDEIYMHAVQVMTGQGGWPLNVFLTPQLEPFLGGTYFPPEDRYGRVSFRGLLARVIEAWDTRRNDIERASTELTGQVRSVADAGVGATTTRPIGPRTAAGAVAELTRRFDAVWGGFSGAPKFPPDGALALLIRQRERSGEDVPLEMAEITLAGMARGGMYDQVGGGFARYSVDERWLVPHFEKMLYNQATLVPVYLDAWSWTGRPLYRRVAEQTLDFVRRELTDERGGFWSSLDADSEGAEGRFYVWTPEQTAEALGETGARTFDAAYGIAADGNFEGKSIPNLLHASLEQQAEQAGSDEATLEAELAPLRAKLLEARERRVRPATDDKVLASWNGLMIGAFARGYRLLDREQDLTAARAAAEFVCDEMVRDGRLLATYRAGRAKLNAYLDDYAFMAHGLLELYEASFERRWLDVAGELASALCRHFEDPEHGGFFFTSDDHEQLLTRSRSLQDDALPSGAGVAAQTLMRLAIHLERPELRAAAERTLAAATATVERFPSAYTGLLLAADFAAGPVDEVAIVGAPDDERTRALLEVVHERYRPRLCLALGNPEAVPDDLPLLRGRVAVDGRPTAYVCRDYACNDPVTEPDALRGQLGARRDQ